MVGFSPAPLPCWQGPAPDFTYHELVEFGWRFDTMEWKDHLCFYFLPVKVFLASWSLWMCLSILPLPFSGSLGPFSAEPRGLGLREVPFPASFLQMG